MVIERAKQLRRAGFGVENDLDVYVVRGHGSGRFTEHAPTNQSGNHEMLLLKLGHLVLDASGYQVSMVRRALPIFCE